MLRLKFNSKSYKQFINYAIKTCDCASLVFEKNELICSKYIFQQEYQMILESIINKKNMVIHPDTGSFFDNADIIYFELGKGTKAFLMDADNVFDWNGINLPEELCFYRNGEVWFTCICHESLAHIHNETIDDLNFLKLNNIKFFI